MDEKTELNRFLKDPAGFVKHKLDLFGARKSDAIEYRNRQMQILEEELSKHLERVQGERTAFVNQVEAWAAEHDIDLPEIEAMK